MKRLGDPYQYCGQNEMSSTVNRLESLLFGSSLTNYNNLRFLGPHLQAVIFYTWSAFCFNSATKF